MHFPYVCQKDNSTSCGRYEISGLVALGSRKTQLAPRSDQDRSPELGNLEKDWSGSRLVVLQSGLGLESGIKLPRRGLGLGLGKICNQVHFQFSRCTFAVFCLGRMTFGQPVSYTWPKIPLYWLWFAVRRILHQCEWRTAYRHLHCIDFLLLVHTAIKDSDLVSDLKWVDVDLTVPGLIQVCLDHRLCAPWSVLP